jgi:hypothetical protein
MLAKWRLGRCGTPLEEPSHASQLQSASPNTFKPAPGAQLPAPRPLPELTTLTVWPWVIQLVTWGTM